MLICYLCWWLAVPAGSAFLFIELRLISSPQPAPRAVKGVIYMHRPLPCWDTLCVWECTRTGHMQLVVVHRNDASFCIFPCLPGCPCPTGPWWKIPRHFTISWVAMFPQCLRWNFFFFFGGWDGDLEKFREIVRQELMIPCWDVNWVWIPTWLLLILQHDKQSSRWKGRTEFLIICPHSKAQEHSNQYAHIILHFYLDWKVCQILFDCLWKLHLFIVLILLVGLDSATDLPELIQFLFTVSRFDPWFYIISVQILPSQINFVQMWMRFVRFSDPMLLFFALTSCLQTSKAVTMYLLNVAQVFEQVDTASFCTSCVRLCFPAPAVHCLHSF